MLWTGRSCRGRQCWLWLKRKLVFSFHAILRGGKMATLHRSMEEARKTGNHSLVRFVRTLKQDLFKKIDTSRCLRLWSLRIWNESSLTNDHGNEDDSKFGGANAPPTTDNWLPTTSLEQLPVVGGQLSVGTERFQAAVCVCGRYAF
jgi:hypothetical protein